jgi:uncharacterized protein YaiI (UPF0178 family)
MPDLYIEIDAHGVYQQALRTAQRHSIDLYVVTRDYLPVDANLHLIVGQEDKASGGAWILANIKRGDICVTADSGLAVNCILRGASALSPTGRQWGVDALGDEVKGESETRAAEPRGFADRLEKMIASAAGRVAGSRHFAMSSGLPRTGLRAEQERAMSRATLG